AQGLPVAQGLAARRPDRPLADWRQRLDHRPQVIIDDPPTLTAPLLRPTLPTPHAIKNEPKTKKLRVLSPRPAARRPSCGHSSRRGANRVWARLSRRLTSGNSRGSRGPRRREGPSVHIDSPVLPASVQPRNPATGRP